MRNVVALGQKPSLKFVKEGGSQQITGGQPRSTQMTAAKPTACAVWAQVAMTRVEPKATWLTMSRPARNRFEILRL
jgi:hypothetical protein